MPPISPAKIFWADFRELASTTVTQAVKAQFSDYIYTYTTEDHFTSNRPKEVLAVSCKK